MKSISPVYTEQEQPLEIEVAKNQSEYMTVIGLPVSMRLVDRTTRKSTVISPWGTSFRFELSDEERAAIAAGKDLILTQLNFGNPITPMNVQFCGKGERPYFGETPGDLPENDENEAPAVAEIANAVEQADGAGE